MTQAGLFFYNAFSTFCFQPYLDIVLTKKFRIAMTRLRVSSNRLNIEAGRWSRPNRTPREERKCLVCNKLEDKYHFFSSVLYTNLKEIHILNNIFGDEQTWRKQSNFCGLQINRF